MSALVACSTDVRQTDRGVVVKTDEGVRVRVEVVTPTIARVTATCDNRFSERESLAVLPHDEVPDFRVEETDSAQVRIVTSAMQLMIDRQTGRVACYDAEGRLVLSEDRREFSPIEVEGDRGYTVRQVFHSPDEEAFYGLGQHQSDEFNYKGKNETLYQYNTKVSVPFIVSTRGYGLLWDNYSLTRWGDPRDYAQLDELFESEGLKATYKSRKGLIVERTEQRLDYADLEKVKAFPEEFLPHFYGSEIVWEGDLKAKEAGIHRFILYYAGYTKLFVDGKEIISEHWRTAWNPNSVKFELDFKEGETKHIRVEWKPDGGVSYLSLKGLSPVPDEEQQKMSWWSEMGDEIDYYVVLGDTADEVISGYRTLTGKAPIMPKWAMGYWQSRERYKTQQEIVSTVAEHRRRGIGLDNIVMDWSHWEVDQWGSHAQSRQKLTGNHHQQHLPEYRPPRCFTVQTDVAQRFVGFDLQGEHGPQHQNLQNQYNHHHSQADDQSLQPLGGQLRILLGRALTVRRYGAVAQFFQCVDHPVCIGIIRDG